MIMIFIEKNPQNNICIKNAKFASLANKEIYQFSEGNFINADELYFKENLSKYLKFNKK